MFDGLAELARSALTPLLDQFRNTQFAYTLAGVMAVAALVVAAIAIIIHVLRMSALQGRIMTIASFISFNANRSASDADAQEATFASNFPEIDTRLQSGGLVASNLALAWKRYRKTLSFLGAPPIRSTQRPNVLFYAAMPPPTWLGFAAQMFVAFGLLCTFLGLVAALSFASEGMRSENTDAMQYAIHDLLGAAASKFVTSVAGIGLSIILRLLERTLTVSLRDRLDRLSTALEFGVRVDNEARVAAVSDQLARLIERIDSGKAGSREQSASA